MQVIKKQIRQCRQTFCINFVCRRSKANKSGTAPIELSIVINGERTYISLPHRENPDTFSKSIGSKRANPIKAYTSEVYGRVQDVVDSMVGMGLSVTAKGVRKYFIEGFDDTYTVDQLFTDYFKVLSSQNMSLECYKRYEMVRDLFYTIVDKEKELKDVTVYDIKLYITKVNDTYKSSTAYHKISRLKSFFIYGMNTGRIKINPFTGIKIPKCDAPVDTILPDEYLRLKNKDFGIERLNKVRDLFVLAANCGLAYCDLIKLNRDDFSIDGDDVLIDKNRTKTGVEYFSVVLPDGVEILRKYDFDISVLKISNQKGNAYAKEIGNILGISENLTFHKMRHYYITHLIRLGVPITTVAKCAGHSNTRMTLRYTHLKGSDVLNEVRKHL